MHYQVMDKIDNISEYIEMGINNYRLELFDEDKDELIKIIKRIKSMF